MTNVTANEVTAGPRKDVAEEDEDENDDDDDSGQPNRPLSWVTLSDSSYCADYTTIDSELTALLWLPLPPNYLWRRTRKKKKVS